MTFLVFSVLPAPDSPLQMIRWCWLKKCVNLRYENTLVCAFLNQISKGMVGHCEDMRLGLFPTPSTVHVYVFSRVNGQWAVWVDCDQEQAGVSLEKVSMVAQLARRGERT